MALSGHYIGVEDVKIYDPSEQTLAQNIKAFKYHPPHGDQAKRYSLIRDAAAHLADLLIHLCPGSRELSLALTNLEQSTMWANASIARNEASVE